MAVELVRIDDRLVHGQIIKGWIKHLKPTQITVVSDNLVNNDVRRTVIKLTLPSEVKLEMLSIDQIARRGDLAKANAEREIILFASPADVLCAVRQGLQVTKLNFGGMHHFNGDRQLTENICLTREDINSLKQLLACGIAIKVRALPGDRGIDLNELL